MPHPVEPNEPIRQSQPQVQSSGEGGSGRSIKTALGLFDSNPSFDPKLLLDDPPFWFHYVRSRVHKNFYRRFAKMPRESVLLLMQECGLPPLGILTVALRWNLLGKERFDHCDLQAVFETAGHDVSDFGTTLTQVELRCLYQLHKVVGERGKVNRL